MPRAPSRVSARSRSPLPWPGDTTDVVEGMIKDDYPDPLVATQRPNLAITPRILPQGPFRVPPERNTNPLGPPANANTSFVRIGSATADKKARIAIIVMAVLGVILLPVVVWTAVQALSGKVSTAAGSFDVGGGQLYVTGNGKYVRKITR